jgi:hypothetical protein
MNRLAMCGTCAILVVLGAFAQGRASDILVDKWRSEIGRAVADIRLPANAKVKIEVVTYNPKEGVPTTIKINGNEEKISKRGDRVYGKTEKDGKLVLAGPGKWQYSLGFGIGCGEGNSYFCLKVLVEE